MTEQKRDDLLLRMDKRLDGIDKRLGRIEHKADRVCECFDRFLAAHQSETAAQVRRDLNAPLPHQQARASGE